MHIKLKLESPTIQPSGEPREHHPGEARPKSSS